MRKDLVSWKDFPVRPSQRWAEVAGRMGSYGRSALRAERNKQRVWNGPGLVVVGGLPLKKLDLLIYAKGEKIPSWRGCWNCSCVG